MNRQAPQDDPTDFSLVLGGPLYQMFQRAHLSGPALEQLRRRTVFLTAITWVPLLLLSAIGGHLINHSELAFLKDIEAQVRFLVALPVLIIAEIEVHRRIRSVVQLFQRRQIVRPAEIPKFKAILESALNMRNSVYVEGGLLLSAFIAGPWIWKQQLALESATWYGTPGATGVQLTSAGYWFAFISIPIFQFLLLRWYFRFVVWFVLLWRVSRLDLRLMATHPDRAGGLAFLGKSSYAFAPILFAQGALLAGLIASRVVYEGQSLLSFKMTIGALVGFLVLVILGPLTMFTPQLSHTRRVGLSEYGTLATVYVTYFDQKWIHGDHVDESILGSGDIQSLADLGNIYSVVKEMRLIPFGLDDVVRLVAATAIPILPLLLTIMPLEELVTRLIKIIF